MTFLEQGRSGLNWEELLKYWDFDLQIFNCIVENRKLNLPPEFLTYTINNL